MIWCYKEELNRISESSKVTEWKNLLEKYLH